METIEERAVQAFPHNRFHRYAYSKGATEQDRIARAEEKERCIKAVQDAFCNEKQCKKFWICDHCCDKVMIAINGIKSIDTNEKD